MQDTKTETPKFKLTLRDFSVFYAVWRKRNIFFEAEARRLALYMFLLAAVLLWNSRTNMLFPNLGVGMKGTAIFLFVIAVLLFALLLAAFLVFILSPIVIYTWQATRFLIGPVGKYPQTLTVSLEGIVKTVNEASHTTAWTDISDFVESKKTLLIFTGKSSAIILPRSAFASDEDASEFMDVLNTYRVLGLRS